MHNCPDCFARCSCTGDPLTVRCTHCSRSDAHFGADDRDDDLEAARRDDEDAIDRYVLDERGEDS